MTKDEFVKILNDAGIHTLDELADKVLEEVEANKADIWKVRIGIGSKPGPVIDQI
jgi:hypothetical protein